MKHQMDTILFSKACMYVYIYKRIYIYIYIYTYTYILQEIGLTECYNFPKNKYTGKIVCNI